MARAQDESAAAVSSESGGESAPETASADEPAALSDQPIAQVGSERLDSSLKALTVGGWIKPENNSGVLIAQGGGAQGFSLYLQNGVPIFATRSSGRLSSVKGTEIATGDWVHLAAVLDADGNGQIFIDGQPAGEKQPLEFIANRPADSNRGVRLDPANRGPDCGFRWAIHIPEFSAR